MLRYTFKRLRRTPVMALGLLLFALTASAVLCSLHQANLREQENYEATWPSIPVTLTVTNLAGTQSDDLDAPAFVYDAFVTDSDCAPNLSDYVKNLQVKAHHAIAATNVTGHQEGKTLVGVNTLDAAKALSPENGVQITWLEGFDESIFAGEAAVCIVPEAMYDRLEAPLTLLFQYRAHIYDKEPATLTLEVQVAGYYSGGSQYLYCPYTLVESIYAELGEERVIDSVSATLADNSLLEELTQARRYWFAAPTATGAQTAWGQQGYQYYPNALDIDDSLLVNARAVMENSLAVNKICAVAVLALSTAAGFTVGMLVIRARKREIALLRTVGTAKGRILFSFALENLSCAGLGILLGGAVFRWRPVGQLAIFAALYAAALMLSLLIFLNNDLMTAIKED